MTYKPDEPVGLYNHNHSFDEDLRCSCGVTWGQQRAVPIVCSDDAAGRNKRSAHKPPSVPRGTVGDSAPALW